jgi:hypothetical protein
MKILIGEPNENRRNLQRISLSKVYVKRKSSNYNRGLLRLYIQKYESMKNLDANLIIKHDLEGTSKADKKKNC